MTNKEALLSTLGFQPDVNAAEKVLFDFGLDPFGEYIGAIQYKAIRLCAISLMEILLSTPNISNTITGYSTTYDRGAIERRMFLLKTEAGLIAKTTIRAVNVW